VNSLQNSRIRYFSHYFTPQIYASQ